MDSMTQSVLDYIRHHWRDTIHPANAGSADRIGLPFPYTVSDPSGDSGFAYPEVFFTCRGFFDQGMSEEIRNDCDDLLYLMERFGYIPADNRAEVLPYSQPPFLGATIELVNRSAPKYDRAWLEKASHWLHEEIHFWKHHRLDPIGLNFYGSDAATAELECGWPGSPRFAGRARDFAALDLNSLLYLNRYEMGLLQQDLGDLDHALEWFHRAATRKELVNRFCWNEERGVFLDYDLVNQRHSPMLTAASLFPIWVRLSSGEQNRATMEAVRKYLERPFGIALTENKGPANCAASFWRAPYTTGPVQLLAIDAFDHAGFTDYATHLAERFVELVNRNFAKTDRLWHFYNAETGDAVTDHGERPVLGSTAGAYACAATYLERHG